MATRRKSGKRPARKKPVPRLSKAEADELALAEEILRASRTEQAELVAGWNEFMKELGIQRKKPISAKALYEMALREGIDPRTNEFSRGIIAMREE